MNVTILIKNSDVIPRSPFDIKSLDHCFGLCWSLSDNCHISLWLGLNNVLFRNNVIFRSGNFLVAGNNGYHCKRCECK